MKEKRPVPPEEMSKVRKFVYDHGRVMADGASWARLGLGVVSAVALIADKPKLAQRAHLLGVVTDKADGILAELSKEGKTIEGGKLDQRVDKAFMAITEAAMVYTGVLKPRRLQVRTTSDVAITLIRPGYERQGIDTSATPLSQVATAVPILADSLSLTKFGQRHPIVTESLHDTGDILKSVRVIDSPRAWMRRHKEKLRRNAIESTIFEAKAA